MELIRQIAASTVLELRSIPPRLGTCCVVVLGMAVMVAVLASTVALAIGVSGTLGSSGRNDRAIVLSKGAHSEAGSMLSRDALGAMLAGPGVLRASDGTAVVSTDTVNIISLPRRGDGSLAEITVRGMDLSGFAARPELHVVEGRLFRAGLNELIVGKSAQARFQGLAIGDTVDIRGGKWRVVGAFESGGDVHESEVIGDVAGLMSVFGQLFVQSVTVRLQNPESLGQFADAAAASPALHVNVIREDAYYNQMSQHLGAILFAAAYGVGSLMAIGAIAAALNTMYSAVSLRSVEIATLRAIGFRPGAVIAAVLIESMLLGMAGGILGAVVALLLFDHKTLSTIGTAGQVVFQLRISPELIFFGTACACALGLIGGLPPALRAGRQPIASAVQGG